MRFFFLLLFLLFTVNIVSAVQHSGTDSLFKELKKAKEDTNKVNLLNALSARYVTINSDSALMFSQRALVLAEKLGWKKGIAMLSKYIGTIYYNIGNSTKAYHYYFKSLEINEAEKNRAESGHLYLLIGRTHIRLGNYAKALEYLQMSLKIHKELGNERDIANAYINIGVIHGLQKEHVPALDAFFKGLRIAEKNNNATMAASSYNNIGMVYKDMHKYGEALAYAKKGVSLAEKSGHKHSLAVCYSTIGEIYYQMKRYQEALVYFNKELEIFKNVKDAGAETLTYKILAQTYAHLGEPEKAIEFYELYETAKDTIKGENTRKHIAEVEAKYKNEKIQQELLLLSKENEIQSLNLQKNNYLIGSLIALIIFIMLSGVLIIRQNRLKNNHRALILEQKALRAQMNPHFLFNALNSIQKFIISKDQKSALRHISKFSSLVRSILDNSDKMFVPLTEELDSLKLYLDLEQLRTEHAFDYQITVDPEIDVHNTYIPSMLIQPSIENAIWHGLMNKDSKGNVQLTIRKEGDKIRFIVEDDGIGREKAQQIASANNNRHKSAGINLVKDRIDAINGLAKTTIGFHIHDLYDKANEGLGTKVEIDIPAGLG